MQLHTIIKFGTDQYRLTPDDPSLLVQAKHLIQQRALSGMAVSQGFFGAAPTIFICSSGNFTTTAEDGRPSMQEFSLATFPDAPPLDELSQLLADKRPDLTEAMLRNLWRDASRPSRLEPAPEPIPTAPPREERRFPWAPVLALLLLVTGGYCLVLREENSRMSSLFKNEQSERSGIGSSLMQTQGRLADLQAQIDKLQGDLQRSETDRKRTAEDLRAMTDERDRKKAENDRLKSENEQLKKTKGGLLDRFLNNDSTPGERK